MLQAAAASARATSAAAQAAGLTGEEAACLGSRRPARGMEYPALPSRDCERLLEAGYLVGCGMDYVGTWGISGPITCVFCKLRIKGP